MKAPAQKSRSAPWRAAAALTVLLLMLGYRWMTSGSAQLAAPQQQPSGRTGRAAPAHFQLDAAELQRHTAELKEYLLQQSGVQRQAAEPQPQAAQGELGPVEQQPRALPLRPPGLEKGRQRCAVYNGVRFHSDVAAGLIWAFQEAGCDVTAYLHPLTHGVKEVMAPWYRGQYRKHTDMLADADQYDAIVLVTFPEPPHVFGTQRALLQAAHRPPPHQRTLLVSHNPDRLLAGCTVAREPWLLKVLAKQAVTWDVPPPVAGEAAGEVEVGAQVGGDGEAAESTAGKAGAEEQQLQTDAGQQQQAGTGQLPPRIQLLALAPCVAEFTAAAMASWAAEKFGGLPRVEVPWVAPLVPWTPHSAPDVAEHSAGSRGVAAEGSGSGEYAGPLRHLCIQGSVDPKRRDYASAFQAASHPAVLAQLRLRNESLLLVGSDTGKRLEVPPVLRPHVHIVSNLAYEDYYALLSSCRAILTAFGSTEAYTTHKASSTLAVALQVGAPLLTQDSVLSAYEYYQRGAAYAYAATGSNPAPDPAALGAVNGAKVALRSQKEQPAFRRHCNLEVEPLAATDGAGGEKQAKQGKSTRRRVQEKPPSSEGSEGLAVVATGEATRAKAKQPAQPSPQQQPQQQQQQRRHQALQQQPKPQQQQRRQQRRQALQEAPQQDGEEKGEEEAPQKGSYAAALLQAFDDGANLAAHSSAWRLKQQVMQHSTDVAARFLLDTARLAAATSAGAGHNSRTGARATLGEQPQR